MHRIFLPELSKSALLLLLSALLLTGVVYEAQAQDRKNKKEPQDSISDEYGKRNVGIRILSPEPPDVKTRFGFFGNLHSGFTLGFFGDLEEDLRNENLLREDLTINSLGSDYGGMLYGQIGNRIIVGFGGAGFSYSQNVGRKPDEVTETGGEQGEDFGEARMKSYYFMGNVGYLIWNKTKYSWDPDLEDWVFKYRWMFYPYLGIGGGETTLKIANFSQEDMLLGDTPDQRILETAEEAELTASLMILELGVGTRFMKKKRGGLMVGAELGAYLNISGDDWVYENEALTGAQLSEAKISGVYLRITVGGGLFWLDDKDRSASKINKANDAFVPDDNGGRKRNRRNRGNQEGGTDN